MNEGQLKNFATQAYNELQAKAPTNVWSVPQGQALTSIVTSWTTNSGDDYTAINLGQLKTVAKPFYDVLTQIGYRTGYPWTGTGADDYSAANIGQVKNLFSFDVGLDSDNNGLPDWWEQKYFHQLGNTASSSPDGNGVSLFQDFQQGNDPTNYYSQGGQIIVPTLTIVSGNNQTGTPSQMLPAPLVVQVRTSNGTIMVNAPVQFAIQSGSGLLTTTGSPTGVSLSVFTDTSGNATVSFLLPSATNVTSTITAQTGQQSVSLNESTQADIGPPATPSGIAAVPGPTRGEIDISWVNNADNADYILLEQSTDGQNWTTTATNLSPTTTNYQAISLDVSQSYYFRVSAWNHY